MNPDQRLATLRQAMERMGNGDAQRAVLLYQDLLASNPRDPVAFAGIGSARAYRQEYPEAIKSYINALRIQRETGWMIDLAVVYLHAKESIAARAALAACRNDLSDADRKRWEDAWQEACTRFRELLSRQLAPRPITAPFREHVLAFAPEALIWEKRAPLRVGMQDMGSSIMAGQYEDAIGIGLRLLEKKPLDPALLGNIAVCFKRLRRLEQAYNLLCYGLLHFPDSVALLSNVGNVVCEAATGQYAVNLLEFTTVLAPDDGLLWGNLSVAYHQCRTRPQEAERAARRALRLKPGQLNIINNLANTLKDRLEHEEALGYYREAIAGSPDDPLPFHNYLLCLQYAAGYSADAVAAEHRRFGEHFDPMFREQWGRWQCTPEPARRLRVGFVSADLRSHSVSYFVEPLWAHLPREDFEIHAYFCLLGEDAVSRRLKGYCTNWRNVAGLDDEKLAQQIRDDNIDILVDLAGHTGYNRLLVFARKPAPVQVTWLGHPNTTGLAAIDWRLTDAIGDPPGVEHRYTEKLWRLPDVFVAYRPLIKAPAMQHSDDYAVQSTPALRNGFLTFGTCNNLSKLTPPVVALWSRILKAAPTSKLLIEAPGLGRSQFRQELCEKFAQHGISAQQLICVEREYDKQYLRYNEIDIALDPFPCNGGTTTCDLLWMGVPLVTMPGDGFMSRMGATLVNAAGHPEWVVADEDAYCERALALAADVESLNRHRLRARAEIEASALRDEAGFARHVGAAFRSMWQQWCREGQA